MVNKPLVKVLIIPVVVGGFLMPERHSPRLPGEHQNSRPWDLWIFISQNMVRKIPGWNKFPHESCAGWSPNCPIQGLSSA
jgi:hypothetical protein